MIATFHLVGDAIFDYDECSIYHKHMSLHEVCVQYSKRIDSKRCLKLRATMNLMAGALVSRRQHQLYAATEFVISWY